MAGKIPTTFAVSCSRQAYCPLRFPTSPSLFFSPFLLYPPLPSFFDIFSPILPLFTLFSSSLLLFHFFPQFPVIFLHLLSFSAFSSVFGQSDASPCDPFVTNVPHEAPPTHRTRHVVKEDFACFSAFQAHSKKGS